MADTETRTQSGQNAGQQSAGQQASGQQAGAQRESLQGSQAGSARQQQNQNGGAVQQQQGGGLARYGAMNPLAMVQQLSQEMDQLIESVFYGAPLRRRGQQPQPALAPWLPEVEMREEGNQLHVRVDLPGVPKENVRVDIQDRMIVVEGERREEHTEGDEKQGWRRTERRYGSFYRAIPLPENADAEKADARMKDGVLEITIPLAEQQNARRLEIRE